MGFNTIRGFHTDFSRRSFGSLDGIRIVLSAIAIASRHSHPIDKPFKDEYRNEMTASNVALHVLAVIDRILPIVASLAGSDPGRWKAPILRRPDEELCLDLLRTLDGILESWPSASGQVIMAAQTCLSRHAS